MDQATEVSSHPEDYWSDEGSQEDPAGEYLTGKKAEANKVGAVKENGTDMKAIQALQGKLVALEAENNRLKTENKALQTDYKALEIDHKALKTDRNALKARYQSKRAEFRSQIKSLEEELEAHKQAVAGCRGFLRSLP